MNKEHDLSRFINAQESTYAQAIKEVRDGRKRSHWMWFIFPQLQGLGYSETSRFYALVSVQEATDFLAHPVLGKRLIEISQVLLGLVEQDPRKIFGSPDDLKLLSSMTLFASVPGADPVFQNVIGRLFKGVKDDKTIKLLQHQSK